jgi:hypothetical protein
MLSVSKQFIRLFTACFLVALFVFPPQNAMGQTHVVNPAELQKQVVSSSQIRQRNQEQVKQFFSSPLAQKALRDAHIDAAQVKTAVSTLSDEELAKIAARTEKAQKDFAAGAITDHLLILIVIAIAVILIIVLAVKL